MQTCEDNAHESEDDDTSNPSAEYQVREALGTVPAIFDVQVMMRPCDEEEEKLVIEFAASGC